jgi:hypothetical protein
VFGKKISFSGLYPTWTCDTRNGFEASDDEQLILKGPPVIFLRLKKEAKPAFETSCFNCRSMMGSKRNKKKFVTDENTLSSSMPHSTEAHLLGETCVLRSSMI